MKKIQKFKADFCVEHEQFFQGHGVAFTKWGDVFTGAGACEQDAFNDALECLALSEDVDPDSWALLEAHMDELSQKMPKEIEEDDHAQVYVYCGLFIKWA